MFSEIWEILVSGVKRVVKSRLFVVSIIFIAMFTSLVFRLFKLQIVEGADYQENYVQKTLKTVNVSGTRGNIYDRNGNLLAYNKLAYAVTVGDTGVYANGYQRNEMLLRLIPILEKHGETLITSLSIALDENGVPQYTTSTEEERRRFLRDVYGLKSTDELDDEKGKHPSNISAADLFETLKKRYGIGTNQDKTTYEIEDTMALKLMNIRYAMALNAYRRYDAVTVASDVKLETVADIKEHSDELQEVNVEEETIRVYNDSYAFAHILGYTGKADQEELKELQGQNDSYELNDVVGKSGIESAMELDLTGIKGSQTMYLDSEGRILEVTDTVDPEAGSDVYLTIDRDLQVGIYALIEQSLAGILVAKLTDDESYVITDDTDTSDIKIPVKNAYYQFINNNILSMSHFAADDASDLEKSIHDRFVDRKASVIPELLSQLSSAEAPAFDKCEKSMQDYQDYVFDYMRDNSYFLEGSLNSEDEIYLGWVNETVSFHDFLYHAVESNWIDTTKLSSEEKYTSTDDTFQFLVNTLAAAMDSDVGFHKLIYKYLIEDDVISGRELCLCLYEQGVLAHDEAAIASLSEGGKKAAFNFLKEKIANLELTPAQMALDPCSASCIITDVKTGEVKALVTYPGYDINKFSGSIDVAYYNQLYNDLSQPFLNRATQVETAPGSIFKVLTTAIGLEEGVITEAEEIDDTGVFEKQGLHLRCWQAGGHGKLSVIGAIAQSCNYYFSEVGFRLSQSNGNYDGDKGIATIQKYAKMFGLGTKSGVEIAESEPHITDQNPIPSSIGQGTHTYANIHLSRYLTAVASSGNLYKYSLISKVQKNNGEVTQEYTPQLEGHVELAQSTWDAMHNGMEAVVGPAGTYFTTFANSPIKTEIGFAGKSGTAEQAKQRANHGTFIGYAPARIQETDPYVEPEVAVSVSIPNGYGASNAAAIAEKALRLQYGYITLQSILEENHAADANDYIPE
ncbi:penicillin-binding transpeptidase domain-containing protein [Qiania dongpingensis]|uniref:Penicillin-binding protein n=1 Tax=Qiania dongpingensis TaxID=2763669 RepID=A0A7G9G4U3_9FIRM|nr:penicillin-binding transpeptidase domain-containing protein [Qiania dongpingensis]QNM05825.1 penicillin-binding protein [Qiania dongpingensis]